MVNIIFGQSLKKGALQRKFALKNKIYLCYRYVRFIPLSYRVYLKQAFKISRADSCTSGIVVVFRIVNETKIAS